MNNYDMPNYVIGIETETVDLTDENITEIPLSLVGNMACLDVLAPALQKFGNRFCASPLVNYLKALSQTMQKAEVKALPTEQILAQKMIIDTIISGLEAVKAESEQELEYDTRERDKTDNYLYRTELNQDIAASQNIIHRTVASLAVTHSISEVLDTILSEMPKEGR